ncbi:Pkinase-domain-containing protein [Xylaria sp. FL0064]|nr:Pkinase-domain-containing protein [Xylaria sp. FL0064]
MADEAAFWNSLSPSPNPNLHFGWFNPVKILGRGALGDVLLALHPPTGGRYALKVMKKKGITRAGAKEYVKREIEVHGTLQHPNILRFEAWFHDAEHVVMILEFAALGMLYSYLPEVSFFLEPEAARYIVQVTRSLIYLHERDIMHRDIKPENLLLTENDELKLADFGHSVHSPENRSTDVCGTPDYMAPEMFSPTQEHTKAVDQWALGVLTYELLTGEHPFRGSEPDDPSTRIINGDMRPICADWVSQEAKNFIKALLVVDPSERLPLRNVLTHPWITNNLRVE